MCDIMNAAQKRWEEKGRAAGLEEGIKKGRTREQEKMMRNLRARGMSFEEIADVMELPLSKIKAFFRKQKSAQSNP